MNRRPLNIFGASCDGSTPEQHVGGDAGVMSRGGCVMNMQKLIRKLQTALCMQGRKIRIN